MISEEEVKRMLGHIETLSLDTPNEFTVRALRAILKIILEIDAEEELLMIFNVPGHIGMIKNGQKTQTLRVNRGIYQVGRDYAVQQKRGVRAEQDIRIKIDGMWDEDCKNRVDCAGNSLDPCIFIEDAQAEGGYTPYEYEIAFKNVYPNWDGETRWIYLFHVIEVGKC